MFQPVGGNPVRQCLKVITWLRTLASNLKYILQYTHGIAWYEEKCINYSALCRTHIFQTYVISYINTFKEKWDPFEVSANITSSAGQLYNLPSAMSFNLLILFVILSGWWGVRGCVGVFVFLLLVKMDLNMRFTRMHTNIELYTNIYLKGILWDRRWSACALCRDFFPTHADLFLQKCISNHETKQASKFQNDPSSNCFTIDVWNINCWL